ncbi:MAG TPA: hypothetical protein HA272_01990 [Methanoregula sp.]|nr:hypothetical protein [Methanoregula sp.]
MSPSRTLIVCIILALALLGAGCTSFPADEANDTRSSNEDVQVPASYRVTLAQPDARADFIRMDSDVYNAGEVVEFVVTNNGLLPLSCTRTPPDFRVIFQTGSGRWATKMGPDYPAAGNVSYLQNGESTQVYRFISTGWEAGRYRIVSDCGPEREFLIRVLPTPAPTPTPCPVVDVTDSGPWIRIDPIGDQQAARPFTITGTTNLPVGQELRYTIFSVLESDKASSLDPRGSFTTLVEEGSCGTNSWRAMGEIQATGEFFVGISDADRKATAIKRFTVY